MIERLKPFPAKQECPRCGGLDLECSITRSPCHMYDEFHEEHLLWKCKRCTSEWKTRTKDDPDQTDYKAGL